MEKTNKTLFRIEKVINRNVDKLYVQWKSYENSFNSWINKKVSLYEISCFPEAYTNNNSKINFELDLSNYVTKCDLKTWQVLIQQNLMLS